MSAEPAARKRPARMLTPSAETTLGVIGGGQLGRMFAQAAQRLGYRVAVLDPDPRSPAVLVADQSVIAPYADESACDELARLTQACTTEFESVPASSLAFLTRHLPVAPSASALAVCQHRALEKAQFAACGVPCAPHARIESEADIAAAATLSLFPAILKTSTLGYDGKGQVAVPDARDLAQAWSGLQRQPCLLEQRVDLALEFSVVVARAADAAVVHLPPQQNLHRDGILATTRVPAPDVPASVAQQAVQHAQALALAMDYVGVLCVEFFLLRDGRLMANEMAPRPHNSGHHSIDSCDVSQFELQVRTLAGLPLTVPRQHSAAVMLNLLGDLWWAEAGQAQACEPDWPAVLSLPGVHLHLYGKAEPRRGRKMGHLTVTAASAQQAHETACEAARRLGLPPP